MLGRDAFYRSTGATEKRVQPSTIRPGLGVLGLITTARTKRRRCAKAAEAIELMPVSKDR